LKFFHETGLNGLKVKKKKNTRFGIKPSTDPDFFLIGEETEVGRPKTGTDRSPQSALPCIRVIRVPLKNEDRRVKHRKRGKPHRCDLFETKQSGRQNSEFFTLLSFCFKYFLYFRYVVNHIESNHLICKS